MLYYSFRIERVVLSIASKSKITNKNKKQREVAKKHHQIRGLHYPAGRTRVAQVREKANVISNKALKTQVLLIREALLRQSC